MDENTFPDLNNLLQGMGEAGRRLTDIDAAGGTAGNLSVFVRGQLDLSGLLPQNEVVPLPISVPDLAGYTFLVTGSGRRLHEAQSAPTSSIAALVVNSGGRTARMYTGANRRFERVTSEFNSHLAVHHDQVLMNKLDFHAIVHAQPPNLTYLSHVLRYQDPQFLNRHILRWEPETIYHLPEGVGILPFEVPGSEALMAATVDAMRKYRVVVWSKHGVLARSSISINRAVDNIEYAEVGAKFECINLSNGEIAEGLSDAEIRRICADFNIEQKYF